MRLEDDLSPTHRFRAQLLEAMLPIAATEGWNSASLAAAARRAGLSDGQAELAAHKGAIDMIEALSDRADQSVDERFAEPDTRTLRIREKAALAVRTRIFSLWSHKRAVQRAAYVLALPGHAALAAQLQWRTADRMWRLIGDRATDFNHYSKRAILSGVHAASVIYWFAQGPDCEQDKVGAFIDRRIGDVMTFEKVKAQASKAASNIPSPLGLLARARYGWSRSERE